MGQVAIRQVFRGTWCIVRECWRVVPDRVARLESLLSDLRPTRYHVQWYQKLEPDQRRRYIDAARAASELVHGVPLRKTREYAEQHARTILGWYESYDEPGFSKRREVFIADTLRWWRHAMDGGRIAYSAASRLLG